MGAILSALCILDPQLGPCQGNNKLPHVKTHWIFLFILDQLSMGLLIPLFIVNVNQVRVLSFSCSLVIPNSKQEKKKKENVSKWRKKKKDSTIGFLSFSLIFFLPQRIKFLLLMNFSAFLNIQNCYLLIVLI